MLDEAIDDTFEQNINQISKEQKTKIMFVSLRQVD